MPRRTTPQMPQRRRAAGKGGGGTPADRLIRAWLEEDFDTFEDLAEAMIAGGRDGVLLAAMRKLAEKYEDDAVEELGGALLSMAEAAEGQEDFDLAELVLLPVVTAGPPPDPALLVEGLGRAGIFDPADRLTFAEGWRPAEAVLALSPVAVRRVLLDIAAARPPADLPPLPGDSLPERGILVLVGALASPAAGEEAAADGEASPGDAAGEDSSAAAFERWRASLDPAALGEALILPFCPPSQLAEEIGALLDGEEAEDPALEEVVDFIETARAEAGGEEIAVRRRCGPMASC